MFKCQVKPKQLNLVILPGVINLAQTYNRSPNQVFQLALAKFPAQKPLETTFIHITHDQNQPGSFSFSFPFRTFNICVRDATWLPNSPQKN